MQPTPTGADAGSSRPSDERVARTLASFGISPSLGFLPENRLSRLPAAFGAWERVAEELPFLTSSQRLAGVVEALPLLDSSSLRTDAELRRAMMLLSFIGNAYVWEMGEARTEVPARLALPWCQVASKLGRPAIASHASVALENWAQVSETGAFGPEGLRTRVTFSGTEDEAWFFLTTVTIEQRAARGLRALASLLVSGPDPEPQAASAALAELEEALHSATAVLHRIPERCDPSVFFTRIRPFLAGWPSPGLSYVGVDPAPRAFMGGSAAQSSFFHAVDEALGVRFDERCGGFLKAMRDYMPPAHRRFVSAMERLSLRATARAAWDGEMADRFNGCVAALAGFREVHLDIIQRYILDQSPDLPSERGTGGSHLRAFLECVLEATREAAL